MLSKGAVEGAGHAAVRCALWRCCPGLEGIVSACGELWQGAEGAMHGAVHGGGAVHKMLGCRHGCCTGSCAGSCPGFFCTRDASLTPFLSRVYDCVVLSA